VLSVLQILAEFILGWFAWLRRRTMILATAPTAGQQEIAENADLTVADAVWVGTALIHRKMKSAGPFSTDDIVSFVQMEHLTKGAPKSIRQHVNQHCVANRKAQPNRACMLWAASGGKRRLFREGDCPHPERKGGRTHPEWDKLPAKYADLRQWYETVWNKPSEHTQVIDPLLELADTGHGMWGTGSADDYVNSLRSGWEASR
jgi:hypothetical protein